MNVIIYVKYDDLPRVLNIQDQRVLNEPIEQIDFRLSPTKTIDETGYVQCIVNYDTLKVITDINEIKRL